MTDNRDSIIQASVLVDDAFAIGSPELAAKHLRSRCAPVLFNGHAIDPEVLAQHGPALDLLEDIFEELIERGGLLATKAAPTPEERAASISSRFKKEGDHMIIGGDDFVSLKAQIVWHIHAATAAAIREAAQCPKA
jgi:hypothetical protein